MLKDIIIAILAGIAIVPPGDPERVILVMGIAVMVFMVLLWIDDLWDKRQEIIQRTLDILRYACSLIHWYLIRLCNWPIEVLQRRRRREAIREYVVRLLEKEVRES